MRALLPAKAARIGWNDPASALPAMLRWTISRRRSNCLQPRRCCRTWEPRSSEFLFFALRQDPHQHFSNYFLKESNQNSPNDHTCIDLVTDNTPTTTIGRRAKSPPSMGPEVAPNMQAEANSNGPDTARAEGGAGNARVRSTHSVCFANDKRHCEGRSQCTA